MAPTLSAHDIHAFDKGFDWSQMQQAPADQRLQTLRGDEWIATHNLHPEHAELATRLPAYYAMARLYGGDALPNVAMPLRLESIHLLVHQLRGSLIWRAHWPLLSDTVADDLQVAAGIAPFGEILELGDLPPSDIIEEPHSAHTPKAEMLRTRAFTDDDLKHMTEAMPGSIDGRRLQHGVPSFRHKSNADTRPMPHDLAAELRGALSAAAPFELAAKGAPPPAQPNAIPGAPWASDSPAHVPAPATTSQKRTMSAFPPEAKTDLAAAVRAAGHLPVPVPAATEQGQATTATEPQVQRSVDNVRTDEEARAQAARRAEERREREAKRFEDEQRRGKLREEERQRQEAAERREKALDLRSSIYAGIKKRQS